MLRDSGESGRLNTRMLRKNREACGSPHYAVAFRVCRAPATQDCVVALRVVHPPSATANGLFVFLLR